MFAYRITDWLWQGMQPQAGDYRSLWASGVTHICSVNEENPNKHEMYRVFDDRATWIGWHDDHQPKELWAFLMMRDLVQGMGPKSRVYVHCSAGVSRSTLAATWLLCCRDTTRSARAAWDDVLQGNPHALGMLIPAYRDSLLTARELILGVREPVYESAFGELEE